jgi:cytochrome c556
MVRTVIAIASVVAVTATAVMGQASVSPAIKQRQDLMKGQGAALKEPGAMMKGDLPFDLTKVKASLTSLQESAKKAPGLFPDDSKTGGETAALPAIWEKKSDFNARFTKLGTDAAAAAGTIKDEATFKAEWPKVTTNCGGCHKEYRKPKQ